MKNEIIIRKANIKDLESILKLNSVLFKNEYQKFDNTMDLRWTHSKEGKKYFKDKIVKKEGFVEVAEYNNNIIGYLIGGLSERVSHRKKAKYAELENMITDKKFRGKGIGRKLTKNFIAWCKKNKVNYVSVTASAGNKDAISLYKKSGFKDYDVVLEIKLK